MEHDLPVGNTAAQSAAQIAREPLTPIPATTSVMIGLQFGEQPFLFLLLHLFPIFDKSGKHQLGMQRNNPS